MPRYMITFNHIAGGTDDLSDAEREQHGSWLADFQRALRAEKDSRLVFLMPVAEAKTVRKRPDGRIEVSDGPYAENIEQPGGYYVIEAESIEEAVEWGKRGRWLVGSNEVREIWQQAPT